MLERKWAVYTKIMPNNEVWHQMNKLNKSTIKKLGGYDIKLFDAKDKAIKELKERNKWKIVSLKWDI